MRVAVEFQHASWHCEEIFALLAAHRAGYCVMSGAGRICEWDAVGQDVFVYFNNDSDANAVRSVRTLRALLNYVAPPGCHLLIPAGVVELSNGPRMNRSRPAVDAMFASAARWFGDRVVAVVLSGSLDDGAVGVALVEQAGGLVVVQDPGEAAQPSMPRAALAAAPTAIAAPGARLGKLVGGMLGEGGLVSWPRAEPHQAAEQSMEESSDLQFLSAGETGLTRLACPECGGALAEVVLPHITYYRCHVGHQFGPKSLAAAQAEAAETKLWAAVAALEEAAALARHQAAHAQAGEDLAHQSDGTAEWATNLAETVRAQMRKTPDVDISH